MITFHHMMALHKYNKKIKNNNLLNNATAISIPKEMHRNNRTWGKTNIKVSNLDSYDFRIATLLDFSTLLAMKKAGYRKLGN